MSKNLFVDLRLKLYYRLRIGNRLSVLNRLRAGRRTVGGRLLGPAGPHPRSLAGVPGGLGTGGQI